ncbi:MAG: MerR family transcriptional regulator [Actinomycetota bacterium]|nr:MAG: MerR family transcriptional regulator [Actinomycetota bacterium]
MEQLAAACEVSVDTVRYYQARGLLPPPEREGRVAWYREEHAERIREIRSLQRKGLTLAAIKRALDGELERTDLELAAAVAAARGETQPEQLLPLDAFSAAAGVPASLIQAVEREGIRLGVTVDGETRYSSADIRTVRGALRLLEFGLPLGDLLALAREANEAMVRLAEQAVELFDRYVREPIRDTAPTEEEAAAQLVAAFDALLPAVTDLVATHFRRVLLAAAEGRLS